MKPSLNMWCQRHQRSYMRIMNMLSTQSLFSRKWLTTLKLLLGKKDSRCVNLSTVQRCKTRESKNFKSWFKTRMPCAPLFSSGAILAMASDAASKLASSLSFCLAAKFSPLHLSSQNWYQHS